MRTSNIMSDKERIIMTVARELASCLKNPRVKMAYDTQPKSGDLVMAMSSYCANPFLISWYVEPFAGPLRGAIVREIGSEKLCEYANERFVPIVGLRYEELLEGKQYQFFIKVLKAMSRKDEGYTHRFGGILFKEDSVIIRIRMRWESESFYLITFKWNHKMSIKDIQEELLKQGWGTRENLMVDGNTVQ
jgi:hypothetical protein